MRTCVAGWLVAGSILGAVSASAQTPAASAGGPLSGALQRQYANVKRNVTEAAEKMAEADYAFRPVDSVNTFGGFIGHIADANFMICGAASGEKPPMLEIQEGGKTYINPAVFFPAGGKTYDGTGYANSGVPQNPNNPTLTYSLTFTKAGSYGYFCIVHGPSMGGEIVVGDDPCCPAPAVKRVEVRWAGTLLGTIEHDTTGRSARDVGWREHRFTVKGSGSDRLAFTSVTPGSAGPGIDDVRVVIETLKQTAESRSSVAPAACRAAVVSLGGSAALREAAGLIGDLDEAARALKVSRPLAAFHLDKLVEGGLLDVTYRRLSGRSGPGAGRPSKLYRVSRQHLEVSLPERRYELAAQLLLQALEGMPAAGIHDALRNVARAWGQRLGVEARARAGRTVSSKRLFQEAAQVLSRCGFEPRRDGSGKLAA